MPKTSEYLSCSIKIYIKEYMAGLYNSNMNDSEKKEIEKQLPAWAVKLAQLLNDNEKQTRKNTP